MNLAWILALVGTILVFVGAFWGQPWRVSLCWLGTGLVFLGAFVIPGLH